MKLTVLTEKDREEAHTVSSRQEGFKFEMQLGHLCNNRCVFCSSGQLTEMKLARAIPLDPIIGALDKARAQGARHLTFLGGEPTIHKGFITALEHAVKLGFEHIVIFTNGVMFPHPGFIERVLALGTFEWRISVQGGNEEAHVNTTGRADSFRRIVQGLEKLSAKGQHITFNMCANSKSYQSLPDYVTLVRRYGVRQMHMDIVRPASVGERDEEFMRDIMVRYSDMAPFVLEMLNAFEAWDPGFDVNVGNLPFCIVRGWQDRVHHGGEQTVTVASDAEQLQEGFDKYAWHASMRMHPPACSGCAMRQTCTGVFRTYLDMHGDAEFVPITEQEQLVHVKAVGDRAARLAAVRSVVPRIERMIARLSDRRGLAVGTVRHDGLETAVPVRDGGLAVEVIFRRHVRDGRGQLDVDFRPTEGKTPDDVMPLVSRIIEVLKEPQRAAAGRVATV